jgi:hypothetical protein
MSGTDGLTGRVARTAAAAAAVTGALVALAAAAFATVVGHTPSPAGLAALVAGAGPLSACVAVALVTCVGRVRLEAPRSRLRSGSVGHDGVATGLFTPLSLRAILAPTVGSSREGR